ncbi:ABC transporter substrate-binding protein [Ligilactobacillus faecis]|uniref:ABC transporter substrate-binding protein n=1 Tax=Ligilactobacillus faecis TaxID=762833 RepID=UPI0024688720|nr:ABC transporter substrate-binding protein [Ligilactobacillus faecis]WGN90211.1 ABC transporter substrate-binding protein [Ligilactobacillus faecis]
MKRKKKSKWCAVLVCVGTLLVQSILPTSLVLATELPQKMPTTRPVKKGGTLHLGFVSDTPFKGIFAEELSDDAATSSAASFAIPSLFRSNSEHNYAKGGLADLSIDWKKKTITAKVSPKAKWSDGQPLTARDLAFSYEVIANKDSGSHRYNESLAEIEGMQAYHLGQAQKISGLEEKDAKTLVIHYQQMHPAMNIKGSKYLSNTALPYHYLKDIPMDKLASSDELRKRPLSYGAFVAQKIVPGEAIEYVPNKYFIKKPKLDKLLFEVVATSQAAAALKARKFDVLMNEPSNVYAKVKKLKDYTVLGARELYYSYLGFKVGHADQAGVSVMNKNSVVADRTLRQAMAYAMNVDQVSKKFGSGLSYRATSIVPDAFGKYHDSKAKGYPYDMKKANALLDKAGYKRQKDGYRTRPNGKPLTVRLLAYEDSNDFEAVVANYIEQWKKLGVRVKLVHGRFQDYNVMTEMLINDSSAFDMWMLAWSVSSEPTAHAVSFLPNAPYNFGHFATKENTELIDSFTKSKKAFNEKYLLKQFYKWQEYMDQEAFIVPLQNTHTTLPVAKNVQGIDLEGGKGYYMWTEVGFAK